MLNESNESVESMESKEIKEAKASKADTNEKMSRIKGVLTEKVLPHAKKAVSRRNLIIACSILLIGCAVYLNWIFFSDASKANAPTDKDQSKVIDYTGEQEGESVNSYFSATQINRQRARDEAVEVYQSVVQNEEALDDLKAEAVEGISRIAGNIETEANIETLVKAKGFSECVAVVSENFANIIVRSDGLLPNQVVQIQEIVCDQTNILPDNVKIIEVAE